LIRRAAYALMLWGAVPAYAADVVPLRTVAVADTGSLRTAIAAARPGDEIVLAAGSYVASRLELAASGTPEHPILLRAERRGTAKISSLNGAAFAITGAHWTVEGLDVRGDCKPAEKCEHAFHLIGNADGTVLRDNRMREFNAAIRANGGAGPAQDPRDLFADNVIVESNAIFNSGPRPAGSVALIDVVSGRNWIIRANFVADFQKSSDDKVSYGISLKGNSANAVIERNLILCDWKHSGGARFALSLGGSGSDAELCDGGTCTVEHSDGMIRNNVLLNCTQGEGITLNRAKDTRIYNNTLANTGGIDIRHSLSSADIRNNIISGDVRDHDGANHTEANNLIVPQPYMLQDVFVDHANAVFRLKNERVVMGQGRRIAAVTDDFCGRRRALPAYDLGAIDYGSSRCTVADVIRKAETFGN
jgi:hypothetical protein